MIDTLTQDLHADHRYWETELSLWKDELDVWRKDLAKACDDLRWAEQALAAHAQGLDRHTLQLLKEEQDVRGERAIAKAAGDGMGS